MSISVIGSGSEELVWVVVAHDLRPDCVEYTYSGR